MATPSYAVPGVYRRPAPRRASAPRARTDVAGFVGVAGPNRLHEAVRLDDWRDYEQIYLRDASGAALAAPDGSRLAEAVRAFFANGGARCRVVNVAASLDAPAGGNRDLLSLLLGLPPSTGIPVVDGAPLRAWGLEQLLGEPEVAIVAVPDLHAERVVKRTDTRPLLPRGEESVFGACRARPAAGTTREVLVREPLFDRDTELLPAQRLLAERIERARQRAFLLLCPPEGSTPAGVRAWREQLGTWEATALYWPWVLSQEVAGAPVTVAPPLGHVAGVYARRDIARGPHHAPANERLVGVVGCERTVDDREQAETYPVGINPLRVVPQGGVEVWGARTLRFTDPDADTTEPMAYVNIRRGLSAVERVAEQIGQAVVFEPNTAFLWMRLTQTLTGYLQRLFEEGVLQGSSPGEAYFVRCDSTINPPEALARGELVCEVGVAIAYPAEFVVFRLGRREGVVEIEEVP